jgi:hypothetical protein
MLELFEAILAGMHLTPISTVKYVYHCRYKIRGETTPVPDASPLKNSR